MLQIYTTENMFKKEGSSKNFFFRSSNANIISSEKFVQEVADNNTTITNADTLAVFSIMKSLLLKHMYAGDRVYLPFGSFFVTGSGTVELESDDFEPKNSTTDHQLNLHFTPSGSVKESVTNDTETERVLSEIKGVPQIRFILDVDGNVLETAALSDTVILKGKYLKFDKTSKDEGVFLVSTTDNTETKMSYYPINTANRVAFRVEKTVSAGDYYVKICSTPNSTLESVVSSGTIKVTA